MRPCRVRPTALLRTSWQAVAGDTCNKWSQEVVTSLEMLKHGISSSKVHLSGHRSPRPILLKTHDSLATTGGTIPGHLCELSTVRWALNLPHHAPWNAATIRADFGILAYLRTNVCIFFFSLRTVTVLC